MAKAIPELNLCVFLENPSDAGNFCTACLGLLTLSDYVSVGRSRFRQEVPITSATVCERALRVIPSRGVRSCW